MIGARRCLGESGTCPRPAKLYPRGSYCDECRPWPAPVTPDPTRTMAALRARAGFAAAPSVFGRLIDERAIASGKRRSSPEAYRDARAAEDARRARARG